MAGTSCTLSPKMNEDSKPTIEKKSFLERMKEREKRQKKIKISPKLGLTELRKKSPLKGRSPIENLKTSPAVKQFIKEKFDREKVMYSFLPEKQAQLQMIQRYKTEIENGRKELPIKKEVKPKTASFKCASNYSSSPGRKSTRVIECPPYFTEKLAPCEDKKLVKAVRFQTEIDYPDDLKSEIKKIKRPLKSILKVTNQDERTPIKSQSKKDIKDLNTTTWKMMPDKAKPIKLPETPNRRVQGVRTKLVFSSHKQESTDYEDLQSTAQCEGASGNVDKLLSQSKEFSNELTQGLENKIKDAKMKVNLRIPKVTIVLDSGTSPIKSLEVYRDQLERGDQETRFDNLMNNISYREVEDEVSDAPINQKCNLRKKDDDDLIDETREFSSNRFISIVEPESCSIRQDHEFKQLSSKLENGDMVSSDQNENPSPNLNNFLNQFNEDDFFTEVMDMENSWNLSGVPIGISLLQSPQHDSHDEEIMHHQNQVEASTELVSSSQILLPDSSDTIVADTCGEITDYILGGVMRDVFSEVEEADIVNEEMKSDENCKIS